MDQGKRTARLVKAAALIERSTRGDETHLPGTLVDADAVRAAKEELQRVTGLELLDALLQSPLAGLRLGA